MLRSTKSTRGTTTPEWRWRGNAPECYSCFMNPASLKSILKRWQVFQQNHLQAPRDTRFWSQLQSLGTSSFRLATEATDVQLQLPAERKSVGPAEKAHTDPLGASESNLGGKCPKRPADLSCCLDCLPSFLDWKSSVCWESRGSSQHPLGWSFSFHSSVSFLFRSFSNLLEVS